MGESQRFVRLFFAASLVCNTPRRFEPEGCLLLSVKYAYPGAYTFVARHDSSFNGARFTLVCVVIDLSYGITAPGSEC